MAYDEDLANRLRELLAGEDGITERKMFGGLAFLLAELQSNPAVAPLLRSDLGAMVAGVHSVQEPLGLGRAPPFALQHLA